MFLNSVVTEGLAGMQQSHKKMQQVAEQVVKVGLPTDHSAQSAGSPGSVPVTNSGTPVDDLSSSSVVGATTETDSVNRGSSASSGDLIEPLIEMKRQELIFDASATVVKTGNDILGQLIDETS